MPEYSLQATLLQIKHTGRMDSAWGIIKSMQDEHNLPESFVRKLEAAVMKDRMSTSESATVFTPSRSSGMEPSSGSSDDIVYSSDDEGTPRVRGDDDLVQKALDAARLHAKIATCEKTNNELHSRLLVTEEQLKQAASRFAIVKEELAQLRSEKSAMELAYKSREEKLSHIAAETKARLEKLEEEDRIFRVNIKDAIHQHLFVGKETAALLSAKRPETLDLIEYIQLAVHTKMHEQYKHIDAGSLQVTELTRDLERVRGEVSRLEGLLDDEREKCRQMEADTSRKTLRYEEKIQRLESEFDITLQQMEADKETTRNAFRLKEDVETKRQQILSLEAENVELGKKVQMLEKEMDKVRNNKETDVERVKHATTEMRYLTRENETLSERVKVLEEEKQYAQDRMKAVQEQHAASLDKYSKELLEVREKHDERLRGETEKVQATATKEIQRIREHTQALADREHAQLRTEKELACQEADRANRRVQEAEGELKQFKIEFKMMEDSLKAELAPLKTELRVKSLEVQQLQVIRDQQENTIHHLHVEAECTTKKLDTLKAEFYELQMQNSRHVGEMQARITGLKEQLKIYEDLEAECDNAIEMTGRQLGEGDTGRAAAILNHVPSASGRRIQQSLLLAQRAMKLESEILMLRDTVKAKGEVEDGLRAELNRVKGVMGNQGQPYQYFVDTLERKEKEVEALQREVAGTRQHHADVEREREENFKLREVVSSMSMQLESLKVQRDDLSALLQQHLEASKKPSRKPNNKGHRRTTMPSQRPIPQSILQPQTRQHISIASPVHAMPLPTPQPDHPEATSVFSQPFLISA